MANSQTDNLKNQNQSDESRNKNAGNFKNDPQRAAEAGRKGGQASSYSSNNNR